jgi:hypothetical protein
MRTASLLCALLAAAVAASALPPAGRPLPEDEARGDHFTDALCSVEPVRITLEVPDPKIPADPAVPENLKSGLRTAARDARARLVAVRRLTDRIQEGTASIATETGDCGDEVWREDEVLTSTAEAAAREVAVEAFRSWLNPEDPLPWTEVRVDKEKGPPPPAGPYAAACRAPALDDALYSPDAPDLPPEVRGKLTGVEATAGAVVKALRDQKAALDELLPLLDGARCRETLAAFDALTGRERRAFFAYREKAVASTVWSRLTWKKVSP